MVIYQIEDGYCYNSDTIFLYDFISRFNLFGNVLDVGTGSGILALLIARDYPKCQVNAIEFQERFVEIAKINAKANKKNIEIYYGNFLHMLFEKRFDFIVSNPPFYHEGVLRSRYENLDKARYAGHLPIDKFVKKANSLLKPKGALIFCYDAKQIQSVIATLHAYKFTIEVMKFVHPNRKKDANLVMIYAKKSSRSLCQVLPPLVVFGDDGKYRDETNEIFKRVGVHSIKCQIS